MIRLNVGSIRFYIGQFNRTLTVLCWKWYVDRKLQTCINENKGQKYYIHHTILNLSPSWLDLTSFPSVLTSDSDHVSFQCS